MDGLEDTETTKGGENEDGEIPESTVLGESTHDRISPDGLMLRKPELEQRDSREYRKFHRHLCIPYEFLELVQLAKHRKRFSLAARDVAWRQCLPVVLKDSKLVANPAKNAMCMIWVRDDSKHRQNTVLCNSRLYYTVQ